ncbi:MAG: hypothetical protein KIT86_20365 [Hydrogenophaga sp.]|uniref:hypothetical protein n=1 Tax=Hydrogenophaga sp. TaxID=1904254 RepID=UPI002628631E|nr:hypothetical protein [Hydrogenophaga sp.]MCW5672019.1 hypothetical protein [Hydrogenophaga sp.]
MLNALMQVPSGTGNKGCVSMKVLHEDFLPSPAQRLCAAQDLPFFVRGALEAMNAHG